MNPQAANRHAANRHAVRLAAHVALIVIGLGTVVWGLTAGQNPQISCHGNVMNPGDLCNKLDFDGTQSGAVQTYEERRSAALLGVPFMIGAGILVAGFGTALTVQEVRRGRTVQSSEEREPEVAEASSE